MRRSERKIWQPADITFLRHHYGTFPIDDLGLLLGRSSAACREKACDLNISSKEHRAAKPNARAQAIIARVALSAGCKPSDLLSHSARYKFAFARWVVARELRDHGFSLPNIGRQLGRDHTTILHGLRRLAEIQAQSEAPIA